MTHDDLRRYAAALHDPLVHGAMQRLHGDVLPRDRALEDAIKSAAWPDANDPTKAPDFWTGDVVTGGAFTYMLRTYMVEAAIAMDTGRTPEQASGDGYDQAIAAYNIAVGVTPPTPPIQPPVTSPSSLTPPLATNGVTFLEG